MAPVHVPLTPTILPRTARKFAAIVFATILAGALIYLASCAQTIPPGLCVLLPGCVNPTPTPTATESPLPPTPSPSPTRLPEPTK
jgi:hypothetical protein